MFGAADCSTAPGTLVPSRITSPGRKWADNDRPAFYVTASYNNCIKQTNSRIFRCSDLDQAALLHSRFDEAGEQRMRRKRPRFEFGVELYADKPWMIGPFDNLG